VLVLTAWVVVVLATQAWPSWSTGIREQFAGDVASYEQIARAAPHFPREPLQQQHAERFPIHWLVGTISDGTGLGLHDLYRAVSIALLLLVVIVFAVTLKQVGLDLRSRVVVTGLVVASAYPMRYLLAAPGMLADALFLVGFTLALWALAADNDAALVAGLLVAVLGRQTAVPVALAAAALLLVQRRFRLAAAAAILPVLLYAGLHLVASRFTAGHTLGSSSWLVSAFGHPRELGSHFARMAIVLAVSLAVLGGAWYRTRIAPATAPLLLAAAVIAQPLVLSPELVAKNEPRLAGLALPALALAAAAPLRVAMLGVAETTILSIAIFASSLHARYSDLGLSRPVWVALVAASALTIVAVLARPARLRVEQGRQLEEGEHEGDQADRQRRS
jgi:hypothetical protein